MKQRTFNWFSFYVAIATVMACSCASSAYAIEKAVLFEKVKSELAAGSVTDESLNQVQELVQREPQNSQAHLYLGLVLDKLGLPEPAAEQFELAVRFGASNPSALVTLCNQEIKMGRVLPAIALLNEGLKKFPDNAEMLYMVGDYLLNERKMVEARQVLMRAHEIDPKIFGLSTAYGQALLDINPQRSAILASVDLKEKPDFDKALFVRGFAYRRLGQYKKAAQDLQAIFDKSPNMPPLCDALSDSYYWLGKYDQAVKPAVFLSAFTSFPDIEQSGNINQLTRVLSKVPKDKVIGLVSQADGEILKKGYIKPEWFYVLGKTYDQINMPDVAMIQYQRAIHHEPKYVRAYYRLGLDQELYLRDYKEALNNYHTAYNLRPWDHEVTVALMRLQDRLHNRKEDVAWRMKDWWLSKGSKLN